MPDIEVKVTGIEGVVARLDRLAAARYTYEAMNASVTEIETYLKKYPPKPSPVAGTALSPVRFTTRGGKAVDFMALSRGWERKGRKLRYVGYVRTGKLGQSWTTSIQQQGADLVGKVGTNLKYAPYVQSAERQAWMHQGRWRTDAQAVQKFTARILQRFRQAVEKALR